MNQLVLTATIAELKALRYTPSGIPVHDLVLDHESEIDQAGQVRKVKVIMKAVAFGPLAERIGRQAVGSRWCFQGYMANQRAGKSLVLHVQEFQPESTASDS